MTTIVQNKFIGSLASALGVSKKKLYDAIHEKYDNPRDHSTLDIEYPNTHGRMRVGFSNNTVKVQQLFNAYHWQKNALTADVLDLMHNEGVDCVVFKSGEPMVISPFDQVPEIGLVFKINDDRYVLETVKDYLKRVLPSQPED